MNHQKIHLIAFPMLIIVAITAFSLSIPVKTPVAQGAFGISPPWFKNEYLRPGTTYEQIITLSTNNPAEDMKVLTTITGDRKVKKWVKIENEDDLIMKKGQSQFPMKIIAKIPKRAGIKEYVGNISIRLQPVKVSNKGGVAIALGANAEIRLNVVGEKVTDFKISSAKIEPIVEGEPLTVNVMAENLGNIDLTSIDVRTEIWSQNEQELITTLSGSVLLEPLEPYETNTVTIVIPATELPAGSYWAKVKVFKEETAVFETKIFLPVEAKPKPVKLPSLPKADTEAVDETAAEGITTATMVQTEVVRPSASSAQSGNMLMILVIISVAFGVISLIAVLTMMFIMLKRQTPHVAGSQQANKPEASITYNPPPSSNDPLK